MGTPAIQELMVDLFERAHSDKTFEQALKALEEAGYQFRILAADRNVNTPAKLAQAALMVGFFSGMAYRGAQA